LCSPPPRLLYGDARGLHGPRLQRRDPAVGETGLFPLAAEQGAEGQTGAVGRDYRELGIPVGRLHQPARARPSGVAPRVEAGGVPGRDDDPKPAAASLQHHETLSGDQLGYERRVFFRLSSTGTEPAAIRVRSIGLPACGGSNPSEKYPGP